MKEISSTKQKSIPTESAIARNISFLQTERQRLLCRLNRARAIVRQYEIQATTTSYHLDDHESRLLEQYYAFVADLEVYIEHYEYELSKVKRGLEEAVSLPASKAKQAYLRYIVDDTKRTLANLRIANTEYKEILALIPADGYDQF